MFRRIFYGFIALILQFPFSGSLVAETSAVLSLQTAMKRAVQDNPNLAQIKARSEAMAAIPSQAGTLPDPVISLNALNLPTDTFDTAQENMTQIQLGISQAIPFPGKLALREQAAAFEALSAAQDVTEARRQLLRDVKTGWWSVFYLDRALQIIASNQNLIRQFVEIASTKYEVGEGLQQDVLLAQLELSKLLDKAIRYESLRRNQAARLNALLNQPADERMTLPDTVSLKLPDVQQENVLYRSAEQSRAILIGQQQTINAAQSRLDLAKKDYYPDFKLGAYYGLRDDTLTGQQRADFVSLKLSMNVPIFASHKQAKAVDQRTSELMRQKYMLQDQWNQVRAQISQHLSDYQRAKQQFVLFKTGIIPQARLTVASMLAGYQVNKVDFLNLIRSQITLFNYETQYWQALSEANQSLAYLVNAVGNEDIYE